MSNGINGGDLLNVDLFLLKSLLQRILSGISVIQNSLAYFPSLHEMEPLGQICVVVVTAGQR